MSGMKGEIDASFGARSRVEVRGVELYVDDGI